MTIASPRPPLAPGETRAYPVLPLRDIVVFPHMIVPLFVGRKKSILALEEVIRSDTFILLATQKNASDDDPATEAIYGGDPRPPAYLYRLDARQGHPVDAQGQNVEPAVPARRGRQDGFRLPRRPVFGTAGGARPRAEPHL